MHAPDDRELVGDLLRILSRRQLAEILCVSQSAIAQWLEGGNMARHSRKAAESLLAQYRIRSVWIPAWFASQTSSREVPRKFQLIKEHRMIRGGRTDLVTRHFIDCKKNERDDFAASLVIGSLGMELLVSGDFLVFYYYEGGAVSLHVYFVNKEILHSGVDQRDPVLHF